MATKRVALITGSTGGIGKATSLLLASEGDYDLALHFNNASSSFRDEFRTSLEQANPQIPAMFFQADLSTYEGVRTLYHDVVAAFNKVDVLFLNAGSSSSHSNVASLNEVSIETFEKTWRVNTAGPILLAQLCLPRMEAQGYGRIVFNSSVAALTGGSVGPHYASSKSALHGFIFWLAPRVAKAGVTVNAVAPALIGGTAILPGKEDQLTSKIPVGRLGLPVEIAETVLWMIKTSYVTRKVIAVDGGIVAH